MPTPARFEGIFSCKSIAPRRLAATGRSCSNFEKKFNGTHFLMGKWGYRTSEPVEGWGETESGREGT